MFISFENFSLFGVYASYHSYFIQKADFTSIVHLILFLRNLLTFL